MKGELIDTRVGEEGLRSDKNEHYKKRQSEISFGSDANCILRTIHRLSWRE
jgi:hypothetical protein